MSPDELRATGEDIKKNGLKLPIAMCDGKLLDGRNRLDAMEAVGIEFEFAPSSNGLIALKVGRDGLYWPEIVTSDPVAYVISANIHRRHLTAEQKRDLIAKLLKAKPDASNNAIAKQVKADDKTVASVRRKLEGRSEIPNVSTRTDTKGRTQPSSKPREPTTKPQANMKSAKDDVTHDIGADSRHEAERLRARVEELQAQVRQRDSKITGLEIKIEKLTRDKQAQQERIKQLETSVDALALLRDADRAKIAKLEADDTSISEAHKKWEEAFEAQRGIIAQHEAANATLKAELDKTKDELAKVNAELDEIIAAQVDDDAPPPADDDGLGLPAFLDRTKTANA
jgi:hypothetical protein